MRSGTGSLFRHIVPFLSALKNPTLAAGMPNANLGEQVAHVWLELVAIKEIKKG